MRSKLIVALLVATLLSFALWNYRGEAASETASSYEYQVVFDNVSAPSVQQLNDLGAHEWELVGVSSRENGPIILFLKRTRKSG